MGNNTTNSKFDDSIKDTLSKYEVNNDAGDWARMEQMLDASPKVVTFKWSYVLNVFIGLAVLTGGYLVYAAVSKKPDTADTPVEKNTPVTPPDKTQTVPPVVTPPAPAPSTEMNNIPPAPVSDIVVPPASEKQDAVAPEKGVTGKSSTEKKNKKNQALADDEAEYNKNQKVIGMGNEPVFGDMIDSSKGIVNETREKESTKKAAKDVTTYPVGWNSIMLSNVNLDSLKKYREKKDTTKKK